jgi:predicted transcriptional regulator
MKHTFRQFGSLLQRLPGNCTLEDVQYHLYVIEKVQRGIERAEKEGTIPHEEVERRLGKWISKMEN